MMGEQMLTFKEYAHDKSKELIKNPTYAKIIEIVNDITTSNVKRLKTKRC